jgi:exodeoxyribonuclease V gamma subunit
VTLLVHRSERADALVAGLAEVLAEVPADPFTRDVVAVPSPGVERWISQALSVRLGTSRSDGAAPGDGVCANVAFPSPARVVREALSAGAGVPADEDPWAEHRLTWPLLEVVDACAGEPWCRTLGRHLGGVDGTPDHGRRVAVAQKLARLLTSYGAQRPAMLRDWCEGRDTDGTGERLDPDHRWQAELFRRLRGTIGSASPAERMEQACARLRAEPDLVDLPERLSLFGPTRMTTAQLQVVDALSAHRDVHLWLPHPSDGLWSRLRAARPAGATAAGPRRQDPTAGLARHPLLRSCGRDARELQLRMASVLGAAAQDDHRAGPATAATLLGALQRAVHHDEAPDGRHALDPDDDSVQVHACHGRQRQVEVLREVLLGILEDDPTLELRDVIVMCPDIEAYAPLVTAAFGTVGDEAPDDPDGPPGPRGAALHPGRRLTVRLADRSLRQTNPVLDVTAQVLDLVDSRVTVSQVLDLAALAPVRARFRFSDDDLERVDTWVREAGVRWGLGPETRERYGLGEVRQNTWQTGLDRILVGVTMDEDEARTVGTALPVDDVDSSDVDLAGRLAELLDRLRWATDRLQVAQPLADWVETLGEAVEGLVEVTAGDDWQLVHARRQLGDALTAADDRGTSATVRLPDVRALLADRLRGRPTRANFRTGHLTVCTMVPMRSVPHRVVCLLGLDDGVFPRGARTDGDDVTARRPLVGERDARSEDRQLFLDAVLAAEQHLVVVYSGADERTGAVRPPAVPLGELLDVLELTAPGAAERVHVRHPLQPFDARSFDASRPFSFDRASYAGARALSRPREARPAFLPTPLAGQEPGHGAGDLVPLETLVRFLEHPVKGFLRQRLGISTTEDADEVDDGFPIAPGPLEKWAIGNRLLLSAMAGVGPEQAVRAERLRGEVPPGPLGTAVVAPVADEVHALMRWTHSLRSGPTEHRDVSLALPSGATLTGTVGVVEHRVVRVVYSRLGAKHRLRAWVQLLALCAQWGEETWEAVTVGRGGRGALAASRLAGVPQETACEVLDDLVQTFRAGLCSPLPIPPATAGAYAEKRAAGLSEATAVAFAGRSWRSSSGRTVMGDSTDADHLRVWGDASLADLTGIPADPSDRRWPDEPHLFGQLARRVWTPLLEAETRMTVDNP